MNEIYIKGLTQNNLKHVSLRIPKHKLVVFTGISGSGKSSIVFDTIAAESQRQMNETYSAFIRGRLPKFEKPHVEAIENLSASVVVDQSSLGGNIRSTVGTISDLYSSLRLLYSRIGTPYIGSASCFSFNDPSGMCKHCSGIGHVATIDMDALLIKDKSWREGCVKDPMFKPGSWYWKQYTSANLIDVDKPLDQFTTEEYNLLLFGNKKAFGESQHKKVQGLYHQYSRLYLKRDLSSLSKHTQEKSTQVVHEEECPHCHGKRLNETTCSCKILGYSIADMCMMEFTELKEVLLQVQDSRVSTIIDSIVNGLDRMIHIGLPYLHLNRESSSLSGGEAQRLKLVRYMGSSLTNLIYIFDEPSTGMHPRDVYRMNQLLLSLRDKGNTVLVVEHDKDVISIADEIIDVGPLAGKHGGTIMFQGSYENLLLTDTLTGKAMKKVVPIKQHPRLATSFLPVQDAHMHNLKHIDVNIPLGIMSVVSGVAGSGKSTLISRVFAKQYEDKAIKVDQGKITATSRSMPATYLGFFDEIRKLFAQACNVEESLFSFNSSGACPVCKGKGVIITELVFMDPIVTQCEACDGKRYSEEALQYRYKGKNIVEVLELSVEEAIAFFDQKKIIKVLHAMKDVGLSYMTLGQPLSTLSGGERQRMKLAKYIDKKGNIYILDEPTTGLHASDIDKLLALFDRMVDRGNTVIIIEHNLDIVKQADWIIDIGPDGGKNGGQVVFEGTPQMMFDQGKTITADCLRASMK